MKIKHLLKILQTTDPEVDVKASIRMGGTINLNAPLNHAYIIDIELGKVELVLEIGEIQ